MYLSNGHLQPLFIEVPCGHCGECLGLKREQWYLRNYWHCKECFDKGGFVLFDTLTYRDSDLPHLSLYIPEAEGTSWDYPCFSYDHYKNFMKRLRINLSRGVFEDEFIEMQKQKVIYTHLKNLRKQYPIKLKADKAKNSVFRANLEKKIKDVKHEIECLDALRKTWESAENIDAFVVTEYGDDGYYMSDNGKMRKATFRPHYHLLFYNAIPNLDAITLSKYIYMSWGHGRTDCCDLDGNVRVGYVRAHNCIGKNYHRNSELELRRVSSYVAKYITKDAWYSEKLNQRVQYAAERLIKDVEEYDSCYTDAVGELKVGDTFDYFHCFRLVDNQKKINQLKRLVDGFHLQGLGFGLYGIDPKNFDEKELIEDGTFKMPDKDRLFKHIPAPLYYVRKLYYSVVKPNSKVNSPTYVLRKEGIKWKESSLLRGYKNMCSRYTDLFLNMSEKDKLRVNFLLGDRSIDDYCKYKYFYQNRISNGSVELDLEKAIKKIVSTKPYGKEYDIYLDKDRNVYMKNGKFSYEDGCYSPCYDVFSFDEFVNGFSSFKIDEKELDVDEVPVHKTRRPIPYYSIEEYPDPVFDDNAKFEKLIEYDFKCGDYIINMWSSPEFIYFDWLDDIFDKYIKKANVEKQKLFDHKEELRRNYKKLGLKCKKI